MDIRIHEHRYKTEKGPGYYRAYERRFEPLREKPVKLLEMGIGKGGSLELWRDYFPNGVIIGLDQKPSELKDHTGRIKIYEGLQQDIGLLDRIGAECAPEGFDVIIDDASHMAEHARVSFWHLLQYHLKAGGLYVIEDWGTGYWDYWPDGKFFDGSNHVAGMVGFIKELVDEVGSVDHISDKNPEFMAKPSGISSMEIRHGMAFIQKAEAL